MTKEPTILVKKSDGKTERILLSEFKKNRDKFRVSNSDDLAIIGETHLSNFTPVVDAFENQAEASFLHDDFHKSLLDEDFSEIDHINNKSDLKEIKTEDKVLKKNNSIENKKNNFDDFIKKQNLISLEKNDFKLDKKIKDIEAPDTENKKRTMGPVEEILSFDLIDYQRLSKDLQRSNEMILEKFINVRKESFLLFMNFLKAWKKSPLYKKYLNTVSNSLKEGLTTKEYCESGRSELDYDHFMSLIELNKKIKV